VGRMEEVSANYGLKKNEILNVKYFKINADS
jgi:hypothetical protein